jgi:hypothetical protein
MPFSAKAKRATYRHNPKTGSVRGVLPSIEAFAGRPGLRLRRRRSKGARMRYFLDTEFNGFGGALLSVGLAAEHGGEDYYVAIMPLPETPDPWVERHVLPYLHSVPPMLDNRLDRVAAAQDLARYLSADADPLLVADWPEDIALVARLLMTGATDVVDLPRLGFDYVRTPGFATAGASRVPHNALHDARALRDHLLALER